MRIEYARRTFECRQVSQQTAYIGSHRALRLPLLAGDWLAEEGCRTHGKAGDQTSTIGPLLNYKINLPPNVQAFGSHNINLIQQARQHMINANAAARAGNFGESSKESQAADDDLKQVEAGASAQTRGAVTSLRNNVSDFQAPCPRR